MYTRICYQAARTAISAFSSYPSEWRNLSFSQMGGLLKQNVDLEQWLLAIREKLIPGKAPTHSEDMTQSIVALSNYMVNMKKIDGKYFMRLCNSEALKSFLKQCDQLDINFSSPKEIVDIANSYSNMEQPIPEIITKHISLQLEAFDTKDIAMLVCAYATTKQQIPDSLLNIVFCNIHELPPEWIAKIVIALQRCNQAVPQEFLDLSYDIVATEWKKLPYLAYFELPKAAAVDIYQWMRFIQEDIPSPQDINYRIFLLKSVHTLAVVALRLKQKDITAYQKLCCSKQLQDYLTTWEKYPCIPIILNMDDASKIFWSYTIFHKKPPIAVLQKLANLPPKNILIVIHYCVQLNAKLPPEVLAQIPRVLALGDAILPSQAVSMLWLCAIIKQPLPATITDRIANLVTTVNEQDILRIAGAFAKAKTIPPLIVLEKLSACVENFNPTQINNLSWALQVYEAQESADLKQPIMELRESIQNRQKMQPSQPQLMPKP
jgi:hypothetical protein